MMTPVLFATSDQQKNLRSGEANRVPYAPGVVRIGGVQYDLPCVAGIALLREFPRVDAEASGLRGAALRYPF